MATTTAPTYQQVFGTTTTMVPVEVCHMVLVKGMTKQFRLYLLLKSLCDGQITIMPTDIALMAEKLSCTTKTIKNHLAKLIDLNWIGFNKATGIYFVRGYDRVKKHFGITSRSRAEFDLKNIKQIAEFCAATVLGFRLNKMTWKRKADPTKAESNPTCRNSMATRYMAKVIGIKRSKASRLKKKAQAAGFIEATPVFDPLGFGIEKKQVYLFLYPEKKSFVVSLKGKCFLRMADEIIHFVKFKTCRK